MLWRTKPKFTTLWAGAAQTALPRKRMEKNHIRGRAGERARRGGLGNPFLSPSHPQPPPGAGPKGTASCALPLLAPPRPRTPGGDRPSPGPHQRPGSSSREGSASASPAQQPPPGRRWSGQRWRRMGAVGMHSLDPPHPGILGGKESFESFSKNLHWNGLTWMRRRPKLLSVHLERERRTNV